MWVLNKDKSSLSKGISEEAKSDFIQMWDEDLVIISDFQYKQDAIDVANAYLAYFGSPQYVTNVDWDKKSKEFKWNLRNK